MGVRQQGKATEGKRRATMQDVADRAGVALSTVSHVLNGTARISAPTMAKVQMAVKELHYIPNNLARELRRDRTGLIGVIVPDLANEFYAKAATGFIRAAGEKGYTVLLCNTDYDPLREQKEVETLIRQRVDGLVLLGGDENQVVQMAHQGDVPVVLGDRSLKGFSSVEFNNQHVVKQLVALLYKQGIRKFGYVGEPLSMTNLKDRFQAFTEALHELNIEQKADWICIDQRLQLEKVDRAPYVLGDFVASISESGLPEVFLTSSDLIAIGLMDTLRQKGFKVPQEVGVVGFDDILPARYYTPALTTIRQDTFLLGRTCFTELEQLIENPEEIRQIWLEAEILIRSSVQVAP